MNTVYYLGPKGTYSHSAAEKLFSSEETELVAVKNFNEVTSKLKGKNTYGILPIENSSTSNVHQAVDLILNYNLKIQKEVYLDINFNLMALEGSQLSELKTVCGHPMALLQCKKLLEELSVETIPAESNLQSLEQLAQQKSKSFAAISTKEQSSTEEYVVLKSDIADYQNNHTRFLAVQDSNCQINKSGEKASILLKIQHSPGALAKVLAKISDLGLNLSKIESRPIPGSNWEYYFWLDLILDDFSLDRLLQEIEEYVSYSQVLGLYDVGICY